MKQRLQNDIRVNGSVEAVAEVKRGRKVGRSDRKQRTFMVSKEINIKLRHYAVDRETEESIVVEEALAEFLRKYKFTSAIELDAEP